MKFLKNSQNKISPIQFKIESLSENNLNQLLIKYIKTSESGFTLIEWLVVIFIIGILGAIAFTNLLNQVSTHREPEGKSAVYIINRTKLAYYFENNKFASNQTDLGMALPTQYYNYSIKATSKAAYSFAIPKDVKKDYVRSYSGAVFVIEKEEKYLQGICKGNLPGIEVNPSKPILKNGEFICPENMTLVK